MIDEVGNTRAFFLAKITKEHLDVSRTHLMMKYFNFAFMKDCSTRDVSDHLHSFWFGRFWSFCTLTHRKFHFLCFFNTRDSYGCIVRVSTFYVPRYTIFLYEYRLEKG